jgi:hypothetical protein
MYQEIFIKILNNQVFLMNDNILNQFLIKNG